MEEPGGTQEQCQACILWLTSAHSRQLNELLTAGGDALAEAVHGGARGRAFNDAVTHMFCVRAPHKGSITGTKPSPLVEMRSPKPYMEDPAGAHELISRYCSLKMRRWPVMFHMGGCP